MLDETKPMPCCVQCATPLRARSPRMPLFSLANGQFGGRWIFENVTLVERMCSRTCISCTRRYILSGHRSPRFMGVGPSKCAPFGMEAHHGNSIMFPLKYPEILQFAKSNGGARIFPPKNIQGMINVQFTGPKDGGNVNWKDIPTLHLDMKRYLWIMSVLTEYNDSFQNIEVDENEISPDAMSRLVDPCVHVSAENVDEFLGANDGPADCVYTPGAAEDMDAPEDPMKQDMPDTGWDIDDPPPPPETDDDMEHGIKNYEGAVIADPEENIDTFDKITALQTKQEELLESIRVRKHFRDGCDPDGLDDDLEEKLKQQRDDLYDTAKNFAEPELHPTKRRRIEASVTKATNASGERVFQMQGGSKPRPQYDNNIWSECFSLEHYLGDCMPFMTGRPRQTTIQDQARYLMRREELEFGRAGAHVNAPFQLVWPSQADYDDHHDFRAPTSSRWAANGEYISVMFDVQRRLSVCSSVSAKTNSKGFKRSMGRIANLTAKHFANALHVLETKGSLDAVLGSADVSASLKSTIIHLRLATKDIHGTEGSRKNILHHLEAYSYFWGTPLIFTTTNLTERSPILKLCIDGPHKSYNIDVECPELPRFDELRAQALKDPAAMAMFFHSMMSMFETHVLGLRQTTRQYVHLLQAQRGLVGLVAAYYGVTEEFGIECETKIGDWEF